MSLNSSRTASASNGSTEQELGKRKSHSSQEVKFEELLIAESDGYKIRRKMDIHLLPLMMLLYFIQFVAKTILGYTLILSSENDVKISPNEFTTLGTTFYVSYLVFVFPQNLLMGRFPVGKVLTGNILLVSILMGAHAASMNFESLLFCRLLLGACQSSITSGLMSVTSRFYSRSERSPRIGYWFVMNSVGAIFNSLVTYVLSVHPPKQFHSWQWLYLIVSFVAFGIFILFLLFFPNSPSTAWFLTDKMKEVAKEKLETNDDNLDKPLWFDWEQALEAICDVKTWIWFSYMLFVNIPNITCHQALLFSFFEYSARNTTALSCTFSLMHVINICIAMYLLRCFTGARAYVGIFMQIPSVIGTVLAIMAPENSKGTLIASIYLTWFSPIAYIIALDLIISNTNGHTKRVTVQSIVMIGHCLGHLISPRIWKDQYNPKNPSPWFAMGLCYLACGVLLIVMRVYLANENAKRNEKAGLRNSGLGRCKPSINLRDTGSSSVKVSSLEPHLLKKKIYDQPNRDITDMKDPEFRYVL